jgi:CRP-like cAMP-binding protein
VDQQCGPEPLGRFEGIPIEDHRQLIEVNLAGVIDVSYAAIPKLRDNAKGGVIINVASFAGLLPMPFAATYSATKFAVAGFSDALRQELRTHSCIAVCSVYRQKLTAQGTRQIVSLHMSGDVLDLQHLFLKRADHNVQALTKLETVDVERDALRALAAARPAVAQAMWVDALVDASVFREWVVNVGRRDARTRIAHLLCEFATRMKSAGLNEGARTRRLAGRSTPTDATLDRQRRGLTAGSLLHLVHICSRRSGIKPGGGRLVDDIIPIASRPAGAMPLALLVPVIDRRLSDVRFSFCCGRSARAIAGCCIRGETRHDSDRSR